MPARNSWGPNYVRFGLSLQDDFQGNSTYDAATRFVMSEITPPGGEWVWDLQIGPDSLIATEVYLPISDTSGFFFVPQCVPRPERLCVRRTRLAWREYRVRELRLWAGFRTRVRQLGRDPHRHRTEMGS